MNFRIFFISLFCLMNFVQLYAQVTIKTNLNSTGKPISTKLVGAFFEDINYAADGGLYAELIQNRSFEYHPYTDSVAKATYLTTQPLDAWTIVKRGNALASINVRKDFPLNQNNPNYLELNVIYEGTEAGVRNSGFFGIPVEEGKTYPFSIYLRSETPVNYPVVIKLESANIHIGSDTIKGITTEWKKYEGQITSSKTFDFATLVVSVKGRGKIYLDMVSLFPQYTFKNRKNGLRNDLAQTIADSKPRFLRFPGGCISHGRGIENMYRWKETVGDVAERNPNWNLWGYHQTYGLGFYEYFQYCEDIGAIPLPVIPVGVSCQFRNREIVPMNQMQPFVDDAIDLVEFANGDTTTTWGKVRAQMGHPAPFNMQYICLGNEEDDIPEFRERLILVANALRAKHPEIKIIGTSGVAASGSYYDSLWKFSKDQKLDAVDEHYYVDPQWLLDNLHRYDNFDRKGPKVFVGEWASRDDRLNNAVAEAAYMTALERNADIVEFSCYAPLLVSEDKAGPWRPDLIRFNNKKIAKTPNYYVQQLFGEYAGNEYYNSTLQYAQSFGYDSLFVGKTGLGTWNTQAKFESVKVESNGTIIYADDFNTASSDWVVQSGNFAIISGQYVQSSTSQPAFSVHQLPVQLTNYSYSVRAMKTGGNEGFLIAFGYKDAQNYYWLNLGGWGNGYHAIEKVTNGVKSTLVGTSGSISNNVWYDIRIDVNNGIAKVYLNSNLLFSTTLPDGPVAVSVVKDTENNRVSVKVVNSSDKQIPAKIAVEGVGRDLQINSVLITGDSPSSQNTLTAPGLVAPVKSTFKMDRDTINNLLPPYSIQVFNLTPNQTNAIKEIRSVKKEKNKKLKIYPNPAKGKARIAFENQSENPFNFYLIDASGKNVINQCALSKNNNQLEISRGNLFPGTYLVYIQTETDAYSGRVIFQ